MFPHWHKNNRSISTVYLYDPNLTFPTDRLPWEKEVLNEYVRLEWTKSMSNEKIIEHLLLKVKEIWSRTTIQLISDPRIGQTISNLFKSYKRMRVFFDETFNRNTEDAFILSLNQLLDISMPVQDVKQVDPNDLKLLELSRMPERDATIVKVKRRILVEQLDDNIRRSKRRCSQATNQSNVYDERGGDIGSASSSAEVTMIEEADDDDENKEAELDPDFVTPILRQKRINPFTPEFCSLCEKRQVSSKTVEVILKAFLVESGISPNRFTISSNLLKRKRNQLQSVSGADTYDTVQMPKMIVHFDTVKFKDNDRWFSYVVVTASFGKQMEVIGVNALEDEEGKPIAATAAIQTETVLNAITRNIVSGEPVSFLFPSTATNTDRENGTLTALQAYFSGDPLINLACRNDLYERVLNQVFTQYLNTGPIDDLFASFQHDWIYLQSASITCFEEDPLLKLDRIKSNLLLKNLKVILFYEKLGKDQVELLQLSIMCLGGPEYFAIKRPCTRYVSKGTARLIHCLKIYLYHRSFSLNDEMQTRLSRFCAFAVLNFVPKWIHASVPYLAPNNDLLFLQDCFNFKSIDSQISKIATDTMLRHNWYVFLFIT
jgi:hypothetical protein